jgi:hypothetical protein
MAIRTSVSFSTENIRKEATDVAKLHFRGNVSVYIEELVIKDMLERGHTREQLLEGAGKRYSK